MPFKEAGQHELEVSICSADAQGNICETLLHIERSVTCSPPAAAGTMVHGGFNLIGLDVPEVVEEGEGILRVIAAVERDGEECGPPKVALIVRDLTSGRCATVLKDVPLDGSFTIGIAVRAPRSLLPLHTVPRKVSPRCPDGSQLL